MNKQIVTIVVPVYSTEKYLGECLDSLLCQSYESIEIICINDGSTDNSQKVIDEYIKKDNRISSYLINNSGAASARNKGIDVFIERNKSDYITFVDSDDTVENDYIEVLYEGLNKYNADVATCNLYRYKGERGSKNTHLYSKDEAIYNYFQDKVFYESPCCKLLKKDTVKTVRFNDGKHFEDTFICYRLLNVLNNVAYVDYAGYNVRAREDSTTRLEYSDYNYHKVEAGLEIYNNYKNTRFEKLAYNKYLGIIYYFILKTNAISHKVSKNSVAISEIEELIKKNGFKNAKPKFYPFIVLTKLKLLKLIKT